MITWSAHLIPDKNVIRLYRRTDDLTQVRNVTPTNRKTLEHNFKNIHRNDMFEAAEKLLEDAGFTLLNVWSRDQNFDMWYIRVSEPIEKEIEKQVA